MLHDVSPINNPTEAKQVSNYLLLLSRSVAIPSDRLGKVAVRIHNAKQQHVLEKIHNNVAEQTKLTQAIAFTDSFACYVKTVKEKKTVKNKTTTEEKTVFVWEHCRSKEELVKEELSLRLLASEFVPAKYL